jgi:paraquat-inducible protein B
MADDDSLNVPRATVVPRRRARISVVWVIPILAAVVALGIAAQRILSEGPTITIVFKTAEGVEAGKTVIKYKDVNIGRVTLVRLSHDYSKVEVTAKIDKSAAGLIVEDAKFWVVEPRVTLSGVSGLGTLLSGNYIGFEVGKSTKKERRFTALEAAPIITSGQTGHQFLLKAADLGSLGVGSPIYYRRLPAGQVIAYDLTSDGKAVDLKIFVNAPYDRYVNLGTRFWNASGLDMSIGSGGVQVRTESLVALIAGGIAFDTPPFAARPEPAGANVAFTLYGDRATAMKQPESIATRYVLFFDESLRGLSVGAPVTFLGLPAGEVTEVGLEFDPGDGRCSRSSGDRVPPRASPRARERKSNGRGRRPSAERTRAPHLPSAYGRAAGAARAASEREPDHRAALCGLRLLSGCAAGDARLEPGRTGAAGGAEHRDGPRGEAQRHRREAGQAAVRGNRRRCHEDARGAQRDASGREQGGESDRY